MDCTANESQNQARARRMYARVLSAWVMDLMALRRMGLDTPVSREGAVEGAVTPGRVGQGRSGAGWRTDESASSLRWRPGRLAA